MSNRIIFPIVLILIGYAMTSALLAGICFAFGWDWFSLYKSAGIFLIICAANALLEKGRR